MDAEKVLKLAQEWPDDQRPGHWIDDGAFYVLARTPKFAYQPCMINRTNIQAHEKASHCPGRERADYQPHQERRSLGR